MRRAAAELLRTTEPRIPSVFSATVLSPIENFILFLEPREFEGGADLTKWLLENRKQFNELIIEYAGILFRNFRITTDQFKTIGSKLYPGKVLSNYVGGHAPREKTDENGVFLATTYPKGMIIRQHHEMAYQRNFPLYCLFYCEIPADRGGETPVTCNRTFTKALNKLCLRKFKEKEVMYRRNYLRGNKVGYGVGWERTFESKNRSVIEQFLTKTDATFEWMKDDRLSVQSVAQGVAAHPVTREELWLNSAYIANRSSGIPGVLSPAFVNSIKGGVLPDEIERLQWMPADQLPGNSLYGDGAFIEASVISEIDSLYKEKQRSFIWQRGDFLIVDNMLAAHGRNSFDGEQRRILVSMISK